MVSHKSIRTEPDVYILVDYEGNINIIQHEIIHIGNINNIDIVKLTKAIENEDKLDEIYKGKTREEIIDLVYQFHLQNIHLLLNAYLFLYSF